MATKKNKPASTPPVTKSVASNPVTPVKAPAEKHVAVSNVVMPFTRMNYILLLAGIAVIVIGFFIMAQDEFVDATKFSMSLHVAPVVVVAGFVEVIFAIMYRPKSQVSES